MRWLKALPFPLALVALIVASAVLGNPTFPATLKIWGRHIGRPGDTAPVVSRPPGQFYGFTQGFVSQPYHGVSTHALRIIPYRWFNGRYENFRAGYMKITITSPNSSARVIKYGPNWAIGDSANNSFWISTVADSATGDSWGEPAAIDSLRVIGGGDFYVSAY